MSRRLHCVGSSPRAVVALWLAAVLGAALVAGCGGGGTTAPPPGNNPDPIGPGPDPDPDPIDNRPVDIRLGEALANSGVTPLDPGPAPSAAKVELGRMLYFDKIISGNRDISCSGCHHPTLASADGIPLSIGTGGHNLGPDRQLGPGRGFVPRHATDVFNRGLPQWNTFFWDLRLQGTAATGFSSPEVGALPAGLENVLAAQALVTVTNRTEMRGAPSDGTTFGGNEMALIPDSNPEAVWDALMGRLLSFPGYRDLFADAFPGRGIDELTAVDAANALAAFQQDKLTFLNTPLDQYVAGNTNALSADAKEGALLFYGKANCSSCHAGALMTDQKAHNIGVPQIGPGVNGGRDYGLASVTRDGKDLYAFRTPPLRNVGITGPYMHNGAYLSLEDAVRHHLNPQVSLANYDKGQLPDALEPTVLDDEVTIGDILSTLDPKVSRPVTLTDEEVDDLVEFLHSLTDPAALDLKPLEPEKVPSDIGTGYGDGDHETPPPGGGGGGTDPGPEPLPDPRA